MGNIKAYLNNIKEHLRLIINNEEALSNKEQLIMNLRLIEIKIKDIEEELNTRNKIKCEVKERLLDTQLTMLDLIEKLVK